MFNRNFLPEAELYLSDPANLAFVMGEKSHPASLRVLWLAVGISLLFDMALLLVGLGVIFPVLPEDIEPLRPLALIFGIIGVVGSFFMMQMFGRLGAGEVIEGRVVGGENGFKNRKSFQRVVVEFRAAVGTIQQAVVYRTGQQYQRPVPPNGTQAAVLYGGPNSFRVL